jgi:hypothetical protein
MFEPLGQFRHILIGKQWNQIRRLGWKTAHQRYAFAGLEDTRHFVAGEYDRDSAIRPGHPLGELSLGVWIRSVNFIQHQTHGLLVTSQEGRNTPCMPTRLNEIVHIGKTAHGLAGIDFQGFQTTRSHRCESNRGLPDPGWSMQKNDAFVWFRREIGRQLLLHLRVSDHVFQKIRTPCFTPHVFSSYVYRK